MNKTFYVAVRNYRQNLYSRYENTYYILTKRGMRYLSPRYTLGETLEYIREKGDIFANKEEAQLLTEHISTKDKKGISNNLEIGEFVEYFLWEVRPEDIIKFFWECKDRV